MNLDLPAERRRVNRLLALAPWLLITADGRAKGPPDHPPVDLRAVSGGHVSAVGSAVVNGAAMFLPFQRFDGSNGLARIESDLTIGPVCELPARAHDVTPTPSGQTLLVMERRPGRRAWIVDAASCRLVSQFEAGAGRHFEGHATFTSDGRLLTTENDYEHGRGVIGVRDSIRYQWLGELDSHGVGPHELKLKPDGKTLVVANGGVLTHPDRPGEKLNLDTMRSTLTYLDIDSGRRLSEWHSPHPKLGIRHIDVAATGEVVIGMQFEGNWGSEGLPLLARHDGQNPLRFPSAPDHVWVPWSGYVGSIRLAADRPLACATSPRGGLYMLWDLATNRLGPARSMPDVCGTDFGPGGELIVSSGDGRIRRHGSDSKLPEATLDVAGRHWDNHLRYLISGTTARRPADA